MRGICNLPQVRSAGKPVVFDQMSTPFLPKGTRPCSETLSVVTSGRWKGARSLLLSSGGGQGSCSRSHSAQNSPPLEKSLPSTVSIVLKMRNLGLNEKVSD